MLNKTAPGLSSENLFAFRVALTYPGSSSGLQIPLPVQHIPLSPCIRAHCGQGCVFASDTLLVPSWMSHLVTVPWPSLPRRKRTADQACPSSNLMEQLQGQKSYYFFFFSICVSPAQHFVPSESPVPLSQSYGTNSPCPGGCSQEAEQPSLSWRLSSLGTPKGKICPKVVFLLCANLQTTWINPSNTSKKWHGGLICPASIPLTNGQQLVAKSLLPLSCICWFIKEGWK